MFAVIIGYYFLRFYVRGKVVEEVRRIIPDATEIIVAPTMKFNQWRIAAMNEEEFFVAKALKTTLRF